MKQQKQHCPEVERLMGGRLPFVTRYGITIVVIVMAWCVPDCCGREGLRSN